MGGNPDLVASVVGLFTIGSLANMDRHNPRSEVDGMRLNAGVRLLVVWHYVYLCLSIILGGHAVLALLVCFRANSVFCKQDSPLSTARLLRRKSPRLAPNLPSRSPPALTLASDRRASGALGVRRKRRGDCRFVPDADDVRSPKLHGRHRASPGYRRGPGDEESFPRRVLRLIVPACLAETFMGVCFCFCFFVFVFCGRREGKMICIYGRSALCSRAEVARSRSMLSRTYVCIRRRSPAQSGGVGRKQWSNKQKKHPECHGWRMQNADSLQRSQSHVDTWRCVHLDESKHSTSARCCPRACFCRSQAPALAVRASPKPASLATRSPVRRWYDPRAPELCIGVGSGPFRSRPRLGALAIHSSCTVGTRAGADYNQAQTWARARSEGAAVHKYAICLFFPPPGPGR